MQLVSKSKLIAFGYFDHALPGSAQRLRAQRPAVRCSRNLDASYTRMLPDSIWPRLQPARFGVYSASLPDVSRKSLEYNIEHTKKFQKQLDIFSERWAYGENFWSDGIDM